MKNDTNKTDKDRVSQPDQRNMTYLEGLINAILQTHGVEARPIETVPVLDIFMSRIAWEGDVEVLAVKHPCGATRCYGWGYPMDGDPTRIQYVCVLGIGWVHSAGEAVAAAIRAQSGKSGPPNTGDKL